MVSTNSSPKESFWQEDPFGIIKPKDYKVLGINPADISPGTFAANRPPRLYGSVQ